MAPFAAFSWAAGAKCAVLVGRRSRRVRKIVIGFDGSPTAQRALALVGRLDPPRDGRVTLVSGVELMTAPSQGRVPGNVAAARAQLLVVGARDSSVVRHLLLGSVAEGALNQSPIAVLLAR